MLGCFQLLQPGLECWPVEEGGGASPGLHLGLHWLLLDSPGLGELVRHGGELGARLLQMERDEGGGERGLVLEPHGQHLQPPAHHLQLRVVQPGLHADVVVCLLVI